MEAVRLLTGISSRLSRGDQHPEGRFSVNQNANMAHDLGAQFIGAFTLRDAADASLARRS